MRVIASRGERLGAFRVSVEPDWIALGRESNRERDRRKHHGVEDPSAWSESHRWLWSVSP